MSDKSKIEWTESTWNPLVAINNETSKRGHFCVHVSQGCKNCYAEAMNRWRGNGLEYKAQNRDKVTLTVEGNALIKPLTWRKPRMIFTNSMTDLFGLDFGVTYEMIDRIYAVMALTPPHTYQNLTKRAQARLEYMRADRRPQIAEAMMEIWAERNGPLLVNRDPGFKEYHHALFTARLEQNWPLPNVWEGVSCEDQKTADERIPLLLQTPAAVRFVSYEPALSCVNWKGLLRAWKGVVSSHDPDDSRKFGVTVTEEVRISWLIVGGESGPGARPFDLQWARDTIKSCREAGTACFIKQLGARPVEVAPELADWPTAKWLQDSPRFGRAILNDKKGGAMEEWPEDLRIRQWPATQPKLLEV